VGVRISPPVQKKIKMSIIKYISESFNELKQNVTWTKWDELQKFTVIVALFTVIFSLLIWATDSMFVKVISGFFNLIKG
jgi:preprotein translocase subunit SecE